MVELWTVLQRRCHTKQHKTLCRWRKFAWNFNTLRLREFSRIIRSHFHPGRVASLVVPWKPCVCERDLIKIEHTHTQTGKSLMY